MPTGRSPGIHGPDPLRGAAESMKYRNNSGVRSIVFPAQFPILRATVNHSPQLF